MVTMSVDRYERLKNDSTGHIVHSANLFNELEHCEKDKEKIISEIIKWNFVYNPERDQKGTVDRILDGYSLLTRLIEIGLINKEFARGRITKLYIEASEKKDREKHDKD